MNRSDLGGPLLSAVSRSFYLTIRILPQAVQGPIGVAYLLARASDTIADSTSAPASVRLTHLAALDAMIASGSRDGLHDLQSEIHPLDPSETALIQNLGECLEWLSSLDDISKEEIRRVLPQIIRGQTLDLQRFPETANGTATEVIALRTPEELLEYTYLVAGCVGEFWTRICGRLMRRYSDVDLDALSKTGVRFGQGLQLVNILRDLPADLANGRCYLPEDDLRNVGASPSRLISEPARADPVFEKWWVQAMEFLDSGYQYIAAIRPARIRAGCFLPWYLGLKTLQMLAARPPLETRERVKVPRRTVRAALAWAPLVSLSDAPLHILRKRMAHIDSADVRSLTTPSSRLK